VALTNRQNRFSMMNFATPYTIAMFEADGTVDADDRSFTLNLYAGISLVPVIPPTFKPFFSITNSLINGGVSSNV